MSCERSPSTAAVHSIFRSKSYEQAPRAMIPADAFVYLAIGRMSRLAVRHLGVVDETGEVIGALSARDLLRVRASEAVSSAMR